MHMLGVVRCVEENVTTKNLQEKTIWHYSLAENFDRATLLTMGGQHHHQKCQ